MCVCLGPDTVTLKAMLKVVKSLVSTERMLIYPQFLGSALLRIYALAKVREAGVALEDTVDSAAVSLTGMLAETGAECLRCFFMIDPRQFEDAVADVLSFLHICTHSQPPFSTSVGASVAAASATQAPSVFVNNQTECDTVLVCRPLPVSLAVVSRVCLWSSQAFLFLFLARVLKANPRLGVWFTSQSVLWKAFLPVWCQPVPTKSILSVCLTHKHLLLQTRVLHHAPCHRRNSSS